MNGSYYLVLFACLGLASCVFGDVTDKRATTQNNFDIKSYGAKCDGSNDAAAVNAAVAAAGSSGTVIVSCMANIGAPGVVVRSKSGFKMIGENGGGFNAYTTSGSWGFDETPIVLAIDYCESCLIKNLIIKGNGLSISLLRMVRSTGSTIEGNTLYDAGMGVHSAAIGAYGGRDNKFYSNSIYRTALDVAALWIGNPGSDLEVNPDIQYNYVNASSRTGIVITSTEFARVSNNEAHNSQIQGNGFKLTGNDLNIVCENNIATGNKWSGITFVGQNVNVLARYNRVEGNKHVGFGIDFGVSGEISYNTILNNFYEAEQAGIFVNGANNLVIHDNIISGVGSGSRQRIGIYILPIFDTDISLTIANNLIDNNENNGIYIKEVGSGLVSSVDIVGNAFTNNAGSAIYIESASGSISASDNCYFGNGMNIKDDRNALSNPGSAGSLCSSPIDWPSTPSTPSSATPTASTPTSTPSADITPIHFNVEVIVTLVVNRVSSWFTESGLQTWLNQLVTALNIPPEMISEIEVEVNPSSSLKTNIRFRLLSGFGIPPLAVLETLQDALAGDALASLDIEQVLSSQQVSSGSRAVFAGLALFVGQLLLLL